MIKGGGGGAGVQDKKAIVSCPDHGLSTRQ